MRKMLERLKKKIARQTDVLLVALILILTLIAYVPIFKVPFLYDDYEFLFNWPAIRDFGHIGELIAGATPAGHEGAYRPLRSIFYVISRGIFGDNIFLYHIQELAVYFLCVILVYAVTKKMFKDTVTTFVTTLFFALMALHIQNIAYLVANFDTISIVFFFLSLFLVWQFLEAKKRKSAYLTASLASAFLAYAGYEINVVLPVLIFVCAYYFGKKVPVFVYAWHFVVLLGYLFLRMIMKIPNRGTFFDDMYQKALSVSGDIVMYLINSIIPPRLEEPSISWTYASLEFSKVPQALHQEQAQIWPLVFLVILVVFALERFIRRRITGFGLMWFFVAILPGVGISLQSEPGGGALPLESRYTLIATYGICVIAGFYFKRLSGFSTKNGLFQYAKMVGIGLFVCLIAINAQANMKNLAGYIDPREKLLKEIAKETRPEARHNDLGVIYAAEKKINESIDEFEKALKINPEYEIARRNLEGVCERVTRSAYIESKIKRACGKIIKLKK